MTSRRYTLLSLGIIVSILACVSALNWAVDPYNYFGHNRLGVYISAEREAKPNLMLRCPHDALIVGNSKAAMIPVAPLRGWHFFNGAFGGATLEETYYFLRHFATTQQLVLISADLGQYSQGQTARDPFAQHRWADDLDKVVNLKTLEYTIRTLSSHWRGEPAHMSADGAFIARRWFELYDRPNPADLHYKMQNLKKGFESYARPPGVGMEYYRKMATLLKQRGITCVVFIPPLHEEVARHIQASTNYPKVVAWKKELADIFPYTFDFSMGLYSRAENFFRADPVHFKPEVGAAFINREILPQFTPRAGRLRSAEFIPHQAAMVDWTRNKFRALEQSAKDHISVMD